MQNLKAHIELRLGTKVSPKKQVEAKSAQNIFKHVYRKKNGKYEGGHYKYLQRRKKARTLDARVLLYELMSD